MNPMRAALFASLAFAVLAACSKAGSLEATGALEIVLESDMSMPKDIDRMRLDVTQKGQSLLHVDREVGPGELLIPASFEVTSNGDGDPVTIQGVAYKNGQVRVERDAITPIPQGHTGELQLALNYLCVGQAETDADGGVDSTCPDGLTCVEGSCTTSTVPPSAVPTYEPGAVGGANGGPMGASGIDAGASGCFDVQGCFASATAASVNGATCTVALPPGVSPASVNIALQFPIGGTGVCGVDACWVVLTDWTPSATQIKLPPAACTMVTAQGATLVVSTACARQTDEIPDCGPWSSAMTPTVQPSPVGVSCAGPPSQSCGLCGTETRACTDGAWSAWSPCTGQGVCQPDATQACGTGGTQTCSVTCQWGSCGCAGNLIPCGAPGTCVSPSDVHTCGTCSNDCASLSHVSGPATCSGGRCAFPASSCASGFGDCNGDPADGCEASLSTSDHCGACSNACSGATPACSASGLSSPQCVSTCTGTVCGGACVDTESDSSHCGGCGNACSLAHGTASCVASACAIASCSAGFADCDGIAANGCETDLSQATHCGGCNTAATPTACAGGTPVCSVSGTAYQCTSGCSSSAPTLCSGSTCVDTTSDANNCGDCGIACSGGMTCQSGACACASGSHNCGGTCANNTNPSNCGTACGSPCATPTNGSATCDGTSCGIACNTNYTNCAGACVDEQNDDNNCGGCGTVCQNGASCATGQCTCPGGVCPVVLASAQSGPIAIAVDQTNVYWVNYGDSSYPGAGELLGVPINGGTPIVLASSTFLANTVAVDGTNVFYAVDLGPSTPGAIMRVAPGGGPPVTLASNYEPEAIVVGNSSVYWTDVSGAILKVPTAGGTVTTLHSGGADLEGIATDGTNVYWADEISGTALFSIPVGGGTAKELFAWMRTTNVTEAGGDMAVDATGLYWAGVPHDSEPTALFEVPLGGGSAVTLASGSSVVATDGTNVYYSDGTSLLKQPSGGGSATTLASGQGILAIAVDATNVYWVNYGSGDLDGTIMKMPK